MPLVKPKPIKLGQYRRAAQAGMGRTLGLGIMGCNLGSLAGYSPELLEAGICWETVGKRRAINKGEGVRTRRAPATKRNQCRRSHNPKCKPGIEPNYQC